MSNVDKARERVQLIEQLTDKQIKRLLYKLSVVQKCGHNFLRFRVKIERNGGVVIHARDNQTLYLYDDEVIIYGDHAMRQTYSFESIEYITGCLKENGVSIGGLKDIVKPMLIKDVEKCNKERSERIAGATIKEKDTSAVVYHLRRTAKALEILATDALVATRELERVGSQQPLKDAEVLMSKVRTRTERIKAKADAIERDANSALELVREIEVELTAFWGSQSDATVSLLMLEIFENEKTTSKDASASEGISNKR